jgi:2-polyprenyl-3-methyl-5-hydroxy-6-metoxy-1,4-benzoquinol methylase
VSKRNTRYRARARGLSTSRIQAVLRPGPAVRFVHPKATELAPQAADHNANVDIAEDSAPHYLQWIADLCRPHLGQRVIDIGAGTGSVTERYAAGREVLAVELSEWCIDELERRFADEPNVSVRRADLRELTSDLGGFDSAVMINVLEHLKDDVGALTTISGLLRPGGRIVLYVPALNALYGAFDYKAGHYRRYSPWRILEVVAAAGLRPVDAHYVNALSIPGWLIFSRRDVDRSPKGSLALWDRTGITMGRLIESRVRPPIGLNVFCVAEVPEEQ